MTWPALLLWALMIPAAFSRGPALLYLFYVTASFGTLQMAPAGAFGGATFLPQAVCAALLVVKVLVQPGNFARAAALAIDFRRLGLLTAFLAYGLLTAIFLPRIFAGRIELFPVSGALSGTALLQPSAGNVTQSCYMILSVSTAAAFAVVGAREEWRRHLLLAILCGGIAAIVTGLVDLVTYRLGMASVLDPFRDASYTLLVDAETLGSKRVVGLTSEASSYGFLCIVSLSLLTFLRPCYPGRLRRTLVPATMLGLLGMTLLSTSSSAYLALAAFLAAFAANGVVRLLSSDGLAKSELWSETLVMILAAFAFLAVYVLHPDLLAPGSDMLQSTLFEKSSSASFLERSNWTAFGWRAFRETGGLGVGLGSLRVSNWFVSILGSTGVVGAALIWGFLLKVLLFARRPATAVGREWLRGLRWTILLSLFMAALVGTMPDIGVSLAALYGMSVACSPRTREWPAAAVLQPQFS